METQMNSEIPSLRTLLTELLMHAPYQPATNYWRAIEIGEVLSHGFPEGKGLDLGCGDGHLMAIILRHVGTRDLVGLDLDPEETAMAARRQIYRDVITAPGDRLPFPDNHFDYVFSNSVLEHISAIDHTLGEVARVLRPSGRFLFTVPGPHFHDCLRVPKAVEPGEYYNEVDQRCAHLRYWGVPDWNAHLRPRGMRVAAQREYLTQAQVQRWDAIAAKTSGILYRFVKRKKQPIQIQRQLGFRSTYLRLPKNMASGLAAFLDKDDQSETTLNGCLLLEATKL
jgi:ubiquinone/menaquinone biosynthesis C-methylase UbiE